MSTPRSFNSSLLSLALVLAIGVFLRLPPSLFQKPGGPLYSIAALHPNPAYTSMGFDEGLYRDYVNALIQYGLTSYPNIVEAYRTAQSEKTEAILSPSVSLHFCGMPGIRSSVAKRSKLCVTSSPFSAC
jgi:hypothetical protein